MRRTFFAITCSLALGACGAPPEEDFDETSDAIAPAIRVVRAYASADDGNVPGNAIDGRSSTRWSAEGDGAWIELELTGMARIETVGLAWYKGDQRRARYTIAASPDGSRYIEVASGTSSGRTSGEERVTVLATEARFVRIVGYGNTANDWNSISEARIYGHAPSTGGDAGVASIDAGGSSIDAGGSSIDAGGSAIDAGASTGAVDAGVITVPRAPSDVLDLRRWKLQLPLPGASSGSVREVKQPELTGFSLAPYFVLRGGAVAFRAHAGGATTSGSSYPRSELREMNADGTTRAAWPTATGTHVMTVRQAITAVPRVKPHVVAGQIHDASDDVIMIRLEGARLFVESNGDEIALLDDRYVLGTMFTVRIEVTGGRIRVFHEDLTRPRVDVATSATGCYFKAGAYTQSNVSRGDAPDAYGEVVIESLVIEHR